MFRDLTKGDERRDRKLGKYADDDEPLDKNDTEDRSAPKRVAASGG